MLLSVLPCNKLAPVYYATQVKSKEENSFFWNKIGGVTPKTTRMGPLEWVWRQNWLRVLSGALL